MHPTYYGWNHEFSNPFSTIHLGAQTQKNNQSSRVKSHFALLW